MEFSKLSSTVTVKTVSEDLRKGVFEIEGLFSGYGLTVGNSLRRVLLSSLPGAAVTEVKIKNATHEFSTLPGVREDLVELSLNFKKLRLKMHTDEPQVLILKASGIKTVTAADIKTNSMVEIVNKDEVFATLTAKNAELEIEIKVEKGMGYLPVEARKDVRQAVGTIAIDAIFAPVLKVNYTNDNMRVGDRTDFNKLRLEIETDGTISPSAALRRAGEILKDHFEKVAAIAVQDFEAPKDKEEEISETPKKKRSKKEKLE